MSRDVEQRVVEMRFDNAQFERGISQSQASLEAFNKSLGDLGGSKNGLATFASTLKGISFEPFTNGIQIGIGKLSALTAALTGVSNIADTVYNKVTGMIKTLSGIDNVTLGWNKYASKTEAVQTIMAATRKEGEDEAAAMERVSKQIEQLSWFADETSYSLNDMTTAVGNFTSAGVDLEVATEGIQGIALWAASAGVSTKKATTAFQQLAQAMSKGVLMTDDWKPLENLNMSSMEFKKEVLEIAANLKTLRKEGNRYFTENGTEVTAESLRSTLSERWLTSDVMNGVFERYGNITKKVRELAEAEDITASEAIAKLKETGVAASEELSLRAMQIGQEAKTYQEAIDSITDAASTKFTDIFESIFGNYIEAKKVWTDLANGLYKVFVDPLWDVADAFKEWKLDKGQQKAMESVYKIIQNIWKVFSSFRDIWQSVFGNKGDKTRRILDKITLALGKLGAWIEKTANAILEYEDATHNFQRFAEGAKAVLDALKNIVKQLFAEISKHFEGKGGANKVIIFFSDLIGKVGDFLLKLADLINKSEIASKALDLFEKVGNKLKETFKMLGETFKRIFLIQDKNIVWQLGEAAIQYKGPLATLRDILVTIVDLAGHIIIQITPLISSVWAFIKATIEFFGQLIQGFAPMIKKGVDALTTGIINATDKMTSFFEGAEFVSPFEAIKNVIKKIAEAIAGFISSIIDGITKLRAANPQQQGGNKQSFLEKLAEGIVNFATTLYGNKEAIEWLQKTLFGGKDMISSMSVVVTAFIDIITHVASSVVLLYGVTKVMDYLCAVWSGEGKGLLGKATGIVAGLQTLAASFQKSLARMANAQLIKSISWLVGVFSASIFLLASLPAGDMIKAAVTLALGITLIGAAIKGLIKMLDSYEGTLNFESYGLNDANILSQSQGRHKSGLAGLAFLISAIGAMMLMMASSIAIIASCANWDSALIGFAGLALVLGAVAGIMWVLKQLKFKQKDVNVIAIISVLFMAIGKSMTYIAKAISIIGKVDEDRIFQASMALTYMAATVVAIMLYISMLKPKAKAMQAAGTMFMKIAIMFLAVALAMKIVSKIDDFSAVMPAIIALVGIVVVLVMVAGIVGNAISKVGKSGLQVAALAMFGVIIMNMVALVVAIAGSIIAIGLLVKDPDQIWAAAGAILSILTVVSLLMMLFSRVSGDASFKKMVGFAAAIGLMGLAVLSFVPALLLLQNVDVGHMYAAVGAIALLLSVMLGASFLIGKFQKISIGLEQFTMTLVWLSGALLVTSLSIFTIAAAIALIVKAFENFVNIGPAASEQIRSTMAAFGDGLVGVFKSLGDGLIVMFKTLVDNKATIIEYMGILVLGIISGLSNFIPNLLEWISQVLGQIINLLYTYGPGLVRFVTDTVEQLLDAILETTIRLAPKLNKAVTELVETALLEILDMLKTVFPAINDTLNLLIVDATHELISNIFSMTDMILGALDNLADDLLIGLPVVTAKFTAIGVALMIAFIAGWIKGFMEGTPVFIDTLSESFVKMVDSMETFIAEWSGPVYEAIKKALKEALQLVGEWSGRLAYDLYAEGGIIKKICSNIWEGFKRGFNDEKSKAKVGKAVRDMADTYVQGEFCDTLGIASPSKVFMQNGKYVVDGLVQGLTGSMDKVKGTMGSLADSVKSSFTSSFGGLAERFGTYGSRLMDKFKDKMSGSLMDTLGGKDIFSGTSMGGSSPFDGLINLNPTITPTLDLSLVQSQAGGLDSIFSGNQVKSIATITDWSSSQAAMKDQLNTENALDMKNQMSEFMGMFGKYMDIQQYNADQPTNVNVTLEGDASKMLKILKIEDEKMSKATGISLYNAGKSRANHFLNMSSIGSNIGGNVGTGIGNMINTGKELFN